nr:hypothetical protein Iba_chr13fCG8740 [Ipomoea batatas]
MTKDATKRTTKGASTSKPPKCSKDPREEKKKRKAPKKRKVEPSKRPTKKSKTATTKKDQSISVPVVLPMAEETSHAHSDDNDAPLTRVNTPIPQKKEIHVKFKEVEVEAVQKEYTSSILPQEPFHTEEIEDVVEAGDTVNVQPQEGESDDSSDSSNSSDLDNDNNDTQGVLNHPQEQEEPRRIKDEKMNNPVEEEDQANHHNSPSPRRDDEPRTDDDMFVLPLAVVVPKIGGTS